MKTIYKKLLFLFLMLPFSVLAQNTLSGVVLDAKSNQPLPGVNVVVQGANSSTSTDFDGKFKVGGLKSGDKIVFSYVGYNPNTLNYSGQNEVTISLEESANQLQEVVVQVGYGTVKKKDATGSVSLLSSKDFNKGANVTAENLLSGRIAGVTINTGGGAPGSGSQIRIRGGSSLSASNDPLIVIDGLPVTNDSNVGATSILASLNPNDIESFNVLKDASASAIYGARAANGVIIITTKRGGKKLSVDYNFQYGSGRIMNKVDVMNAQQYSSFLQQNHPTRIGELGIINPTIVDNPSTPQNEAQQLYNTDWQDAIYRRTDFVDNNLSIRGQLFNRIPAKLTINNTYQEGLRLTNEFTRNNVSIALNPRFFDDHLKLNVSAFYSNERNRFANGVEGTAIRFDPTKPVYNPFSNNFSGFFEYENPSDPTGLAAQSPRNPVADLLQTYDKGVNNRFLGNFEIDYKFHFFPALRAVVNLGFDESNGVRRINKGTVGVGSSEILNNEFIGTSIYDEDTRRNKLLDVYFVYNKRFGTTSVEATAGYSYQKFQYSGFRSGNRNNPTTVESFPASPDEVLIGYFARTNIGFKDKYIITLAMRRDGTSRFSEENRWGNFPSAAFAWKMKEDFFKDSKLISDLKLRIGWGISGQQAIPVGDFYLPRYTTGLPNSQYSFGGDSFLVGVPQSYNPNLKWEETTSYNIGLDYGLFNGKISGGLDVFYKLTDDLFFNETPYADGSNFGNQGPANGGSFSTKGIELNLNADIVNNDNFNWNVNFNATKFERRIESLPAGVDEQFTGSSGAGFGGTSQIRRVGFTPDSFFVYKQLYNTDGSPIDGAFADLNGDGIVNENDRYLYKNADPDAVFGFSSNMNYKNFDFSFFLRASVGNRVLNQVNATRAYSDYAVNNDGQLANIPNSFNDTGFVVPTGIIALSDIYVENASFLRMDNITLGYTFPKWLEGKASLRLFTGIQNAFVITKYSGLDPEINGGLDNTIYPRQRQFLFGANLKF
ncbi:SusC/RagA family TonB-linked outer membrane protein [Flavobacterium sp.]|jgi:TonB-linked SusC/RagA family outer membrane protein|uniref:SusC/RagA family TonB-linked outer membrane protein n=1 Tax=Flavobacterium sp. TaxID=239 RepID=UPI0037C0777A